MRNGVTVSWAHDSREDIDLERGCTEDPESIVRDLAGGTPDLYFYAGTRGHISPQQRDVRLVWEGLIFHSIKVGRYGAMGSK